MPRSTPLQRRHCLALLLAAGATGLSLPARHAAAGGELQVLRPRVDALPAVALRTMQGEARTLDRELLAEVPLVLNFVFTTCSASCSVQTAMLAELQRERTAQRRALKIASITIDPDNDTPEQLRRFARKFGADWEFYTGRFDDLLRVQKHFDVYRGSKASHPPVLMLRRNARAPWVRVEGFPGVRELMTLIDTLPNAG